MATRNEIAGNASGASAGMEAMFESAGKAVGAAFANMLRRSIASALETPKKSMTPTEKRETAARYMRLPNTVIEALESVDAWVTPQGLIGIPPVNEWLCDVKRPDGSRWIMTGYSEPVYDVDTGKFLGVTGYSGIIPKEEM